MKEPTPIIRLAKIVISASLFFMLLFSFGASIIYETILGVILTIMLGFLFVAGFYSSFLRSWIASE